MSAFNAVRSLARTAFSQALGMVEKDPEGFLQKRMHIQEHLRKITDRRTKATLEIKAFDTGVKPTGVLLDELHEIAKAPAAERLIGQLRGGLLPNPEGFLVFITTQSDEPPQGAFRSELDGGARDTRWPRTGRNAADPLRISGGNCRRPDEPAGVAGS